MLVYADRSGQVTVTRSRTFRSGNGEAVRLLKDVAFGDDVELVRIRFGDVRTMYPVAISIPKILAKLTSLPAPDAIEPRDDVSPDERGDY